MNIKEAGYELFAKVHRSSHRKEVESSVLKLKSSSRGLGNKIYPSPVLGLLLWPQDRIKKRSGIAPIDEFRSWSETEQRVLFDVHTQIHLLNKLCLTPLTDVLPDRLIAVNPYNEVEGARSWEELETVLFSKQDAKEMAQIFHQHPAFQVALADLDSIKADSHSEHYSQHFSEMNDEVFNAGAGEDIEWIEEFQRPTKPSLLSESLVRHLAALISLRNSIANLDQLIYQAVFQGQLTRLDQSSIVDYLYSRAGSRFSAWTMYLPTSSELWAIECTDLIMVSLNPKHGLKDWLCHIVQQTLLGGRNDCYSIEMLVIDDNLDSYGDLLHLSRW